MKLSVSAVVLVALWGASAFGVEPVPIPERCTNGAGSTEFQTITSLEKVMVRERYPEQVWVETGRTVQRVVCHQRVQIGWQEICVWRQDCLLCGHWETVLTPVFGLQPVVESFPERELRTVWKERWVPRYRNVPKRFLSR